MKAFVYIIQSLKDNSYYVGSTQNCNRRIMQHNIGNVTATKNKRPYKLVFYQKFENTKLARMVEKKIKSWKRKDFIEKIINDNRIKFMDG